MAERSGQDEELRRKLQARLEQDPGLSSYGLKADVVEGEAQITGAVDVLAEKEQALRVARGIGGIRGVSDGIAVSTDRNITEGDVAAEVMEELRADPQVNTERIRAKTSGGTVILAGQEEDRVALEAAKEAAARARGVTQVLSQVRIHPPEPDLADIFHGQVNNDHE
ncbi:MAG: BON domain-containing protein [Firmicutes bacterium]|nr:BON domain-containing protein [Bacillota bacterium]